MFSFRMLLCAAALTLLAVAVESQSDGNLSGAELTRLYNSPVYKAEKLRRPLGSGTFMLGPISHSGVRVTLGDGTQWLIHKGKDNGVSYDTVVTRGEHMSSRWEVDRVKDFQGTKTVADFVRTGGSDYSWYFNNCHRASDGMMNQ